MSSVTSISGAAAGEDDHASITAMYASAPLSSRSVHQLFVTQTTGSARASWFFWVLGPDAHLAVVVRGATCLKEKIEGCPSSPVMSPSSEMRNRSKRA